MKSLIHPICRVAMTLWFGGTVLCGGESGRDIHHEIKVQRACEVAIWAMPAVSPCVSEDRILIDERGGGAYFWITYLPKALGGGTFYLTGLRDRDGKPDERQAHL